MERFQGRGNEWLRQMQLVVSDRLRVQREFIDLRRRVFANTDRSDRLLAEQLAQQEYLVQVYLMALQKHWQGKDFRSLGRGAEVFATLQAMLLQLHESRNPLGQMAGQTYFESTDPSLPNWRHYLVRLVGKDGAGGLVARGRSEVNDAVRNLRDALRDVDALENNIFEARDEYKKELTDLCGPDVMSDAKTVCDQMLDWLGTRAEFDGEETSFVFVIRDVTELVQREKVLTQTLEDLRVSHEALKNAKVEVAQAKKLELIGRLAVCVAHDIKNPLARLRMGIDYFSKGAARPAKDTAFMLQSMNDALKRVDSVIGELLDFSSSHPLRIEPEDLHSVIDQSLLFVKHEMDMKGIKIRKDFSKDACPVRMDRSKMEHVFVNLFLNAVHAMPEGGELRVGTAPRRVHIPGGKVGRRKDDAFRPGELAVRVEIEDTGMGIPREIIDKVFEPFFSTRRVQGGTGLGLSIAHNIIELHGGAIDIENRKEGGVRVVLLLKA